MMAHGNVRSRGVYFPSSPVLSLSLPHLLSHDSSKKYFITSPLPHPPYPVTIMALTGFFHCLSFLCVCIPSHSQPRSTGQRFGSARDMLAKRKVMVFTTAAPHCWQPVLPKWHTLFGFPTFIELHSTSSLSQSTPHTQTHTFNQPHSCISSQCVTKRSRRQILNIAKYHNRQHWKWSYRLLPFSLFFFFVQNPVNWG